MQTIKRTQTRTVPILLRAEHEDRGPYYLVDRAGYGVSWMKPVVESVRGEVDESRPLYMASFSTTRRTTWIPVFERALLAFDLIESDESVTPREAKTAADETARRLGSESTRADAYFYALSLVERARARTRKGNRAGRYSSSDVVRAELLSPMPGITKAELICQTRPLWEEAYAADPYRTEENTKAVLGREVFVWDNLTAAEMRALRRAIYPTVLEARG